MMNTKKMIKTVKQFYYCMYVWYLYVYIIDTYIGMKTSQSFKSDFFALLAFFVTLCKYAFRPLFGDAIKNFYMGYLHI